MTTNRAELVVAEDLAMICQAASEQIRRLEGDSVLITGGGGFLGHYLVQALLEWNRTHADEPIRVRVADNWMRGEPEWMRRCRDDEHLEVLTLDITEPLPDDFSIGNWVIHAASIASPTFYREYPIETMDANVNGLRGLLDRACADESQDLRGMLFFSSSEVYGDPAPEAIPTSEDYTGRVSFTGPRACYDESKRYGETLCVNFARQRGVPVSSARPFNNYGPGLALSDRRVIPDFASDILAGRDITLLSSGTPTRTFCYVADAVVGYLKVLVDGRRGEAYNIGTETPEISMRELAERMVALARSEFGYQGSVVMSTSDDADYLVDNPDRRCPDIGKARHELSYEPQVGIDEGLRRTMVWYEGQESNR
jgi:UDP-glucuronate decarboxylase